MARGAGADAPAPRRAGPQRGEGAWWGGRGGAGGGLPRGAGRGWGGAASCPAAARRTDMLMRLAVAVAVTVAVGVAAADEKDDCRAKGGNWSTGRATGCRVKGKREGLWVLTDDAGRVRERSEWKNGLRDGPYTQYPSTCQVAEPRSYSKRTHHGAGLAN